MPRRCQGCSYPGQGVQTHDDVQTVFADGIIGDLFQVLLLVTRKQLRTWHLDPRSVCRRNAKRVDANFGNLVDIGLGDERGIASFES